MSDHTAVAPVQSAKSGPPRALLIVLGLAATVVAVAGMKAVSDIIAPTFFALTLVITTHPLQRWLVRKRVPKVLAAGICLIILYVVVLGLMAALTLSIAQLAISMPRYQDKFISLFTDLLSWATSLGVDQAQIDQVASKFDVTSLFSAARSFADSLLGATSAMVFLITVMFFLVADAMDIPRRLDLTSKFQPQFAAALDAFADGVRRYWLVSAVFGLIVAIFDVVALYIIGVPLALLWGLVSFITNFIPNIGFVLGLVPPALLALLEGGVGKMVAVIVVYCVLNVTIQVIIQPKFTGDAVGVTTAISFLSLAFWAFVLGPLGALLALPMTLLVKTMLVDGDPRAQWVNAFISSNPEGPKAKSAGSKGSKGADSLEPEPKGPAPQES
ncbi:MAG: AI-2E family transporter [Propionibacteriales bacterium]|nr:AI-2E family transporter [Propionibacteriales bacterium]